MAPLLQAYAQALPLVFAHATAWFFVSLWRKRNDVADVAWGGGFVLVAWATLLPRGLALDRALLVTLLVSLWALRLMVHIHRRNHGKPEDHRYRAWREQWGDTILWRSYLQVFLLQALFMLVVALPVVIINTSTAAPLRACDILGVFMWISGFLVEAVADRQLLRFTRDPRNRGQILQQGLWSWSRHPNYFGEVLQWWGIGVLALAVPLGWMGLMGPALLTYLILKVSGIPMLEKAAARKPGWSEYRARVSPFLPLPPRKAATPAQEEMP